MPKVLILTGATGGGHLSLAEAMRDLLLAEGAGHVDVVDALPAAAQCHYRLVSRHALGLWAAGYALTDGRVRAAVAHHAWSLRLARSLAQTVAGGYDLVLSTHPFLTAEVVRAMRRGHVDVPFAMLLSDPAALHATWLAARRTATTFAPTREAWSLARSAGFPDERLVLGGWPVRRQFLEAARAGAPAARATRRALGLDPDLLTFFVQGGADGAARVARSLDVVLDAAPGRVQVLLAAGSNERLARRFAGVPGVRVLPWTRDVAPLMAAADVVAGKAGPNTIFEAVTLGKPFVATTFIPGQEVDNLAFVRTHGLGWVALDEADQVALVHRLTTGTAELDRVRRDVDRHRERNRAACAAVGRRLLALVDERQDVASAAAVPPPRRRHVIARRRAKERV